MENEQHYTILYVDEKRTQYTIFESTDLDSLAQIYVRILQFESMFRTFPNESCRVVLEQDFNYDPDTEVWNMANIVNYPRPKGRELLVFASTEPLVSTQQNRVA